MRIEKLTRMPGEMQDGLISILSKKMLPLAGLDDELLALAFLPSLVNVLRYGSARKVDTGMLASVVDGLIARACIALPHGLRGLTDERAIDVLKRLIGADQAIRPLQSDDHLAFWFEALEDGATSESSHPLLAGRCTVHRASHRG